MSPMTRDNTYMPQLTGDPPIDAEHGCRATLGQTALHTDRDHQARKKHRS